MATLKVGITFLLTILTIMNITGVPQGSIVSPTLFWLHIAGTRWYKKQSCSSHWIISPCSLSVPTHANHTRRQYAIAHCSGRQWPTPSKLPIKRQRKDPIHYMTSLHCPLLTRQNPKCYLFCSLRKISIEIEFFLHLSKGIYCSLYYIFQKK